MRAADMEADQRKLDVPQDVVAALRENAARG
jgi:hypothetical protein